jgi:beta-lactamase class A
MQFRKLFTSFIVICLITKSCFSQNTTIKNEILKLIKPFKGKVGVAITNIKTGEKILVNAKEAYPMQSVYKFHLALAVFDQIDKGNWKLEQKINLKKSDLLANTHSPLRDKYPDGKTDIALKEIIQATVSQSDNNGCDFMFRMIGGCQNVNKFIKKYQKAGINIAFTEQEMHHDSAFQYINYATPVAMNELLTKFHKRKILSDKSTADLWQMLTETTTAPNRIKGNLPKGTLLGHKSGWSGGDDRGYTNAINDAGIMILPNESAIAITIFIKDTVEKSHYSDQLSAKIGRLAYDYFLLK